MEICEPPAPEASFIHNLHRSTYDGTFISRNPARGRLRFALEKGHPSPEPSAPVRQAPQLPEDHVAHEPAALGGPYAAAAVLGETEDFQLGESGGH